MVIEGMELMEDLGVGQEEQYGQGGGRGSNGVGTSRLEGVEELLLTCCKMGS